MAPRAAPVAILQQVVSEFEAEGGQLAPFLPAPKWAGARPGYFFGRGAQGQG